MAIPVALSLVGATPSDATKIEAVPGTSEGRWRLALLPQWTDEFTADFGHFTEVDTGNNVELVAGTLEFTGNGSYNVNGLHLTDLLDFSKPGRFTVNGLTLHEVKYFFIGFAAGAALLHNDMGLKLYHSVMDLYAYQTGAVVLADACLAESTPYKMEFEYTTDKRLSIYITGGAYTARTLLIECYCKLTNLGFQVNAIHPAVTDKHSLSSIKHERGYADDDPYLETDTADGKKSGRGWNTKAFALRDGDSATGLTFAFAAKDVDSFETADFSSYYTEAELQNGDLGTIAGCYMRCRIKFSSDGATAREIGEAALEARDGPGLRAHCRRASSFAA